MRPDSLTLRAEEDREMGQMRRKGPETQRRAAADERVDQMRDLSLCRNNSAHAQRRRPEGQSAYTEDRANNRIRTKRRGAECDSRSASHQA